MGSSYLIWLFAPSVLWKRKDFGSIRKKSLLKAKTLRLETEGVNVCDLEFDPAFALHPAASINDANLVKSRKAKYGSDPRSLVLSRTTHLPTDEQTSKNLTRF